MINLRKVLVVGGGSSGWMAAALLSKRLKGTEIALIEASDIPILGVGESTNLTIKYFMDELGYNEKSFMRACDASFKIAIRFEDFNRLGGVFYHPFGRPRPRLRRQVDFMPGAQAMCPNFEMARSGNLFSRKCAYSYQLDAGLFAEYLKRDCVHSDSVLHIVDHVEEVRLTESGEIASICTRNSGELTADLYIDCTGFRSVLLGGAMQEPFESYSCFLPNDRAVAVRVPYRDKATELVTYTNCKAMSAGWVWKIPLWSRMGMGYVYSSTYLSRADAENEFRQLLGVSRSHDLQFSHLDIKTGRYVRGWVANCVAIGIAYGFLEPLESTGLSLTQISIRDLAAALSSGMSMSVEREMYNSRQRQLFDSTRDFIMAHYVLTARDDTPYWRDVRCIPSIPKSLVSILEDARAGSYQTVLNNPQSFYPGGSWNCILSGMEFFGKYRIQAPQFSFKKHKTLTRILEREVFDGDYCERVQSAVVDPSSHPTWYPTW